MFHISQLRKYIKDESHVLDYSKLEMQPDFESTPRGGVNRCMANLTINYAELKINCNTLSVTKECSRILGVGLWTISTKFF